MSKISQENYEMSELAWAQKMLRERIAPMGSAGSKMERIRLASQKLKWKYSRAMAVWYGDERASIKPVELRAVEEKSGERFGQKHEDLEDVDDLIERAEALLSSKNPRVRRALFSAMRTFARNLVGPRIERGR